MLGTGLVLFTVGAIGFVRERRRLSTMVLMLAGLASGGMATLVLLADSGVMGAVPLVIIVALLLACFLGYPILALFLIGNGITMLRQTWDGDVTSLKGRVGVVGGGDVAMDCARVAKRLGGDVTKFVPPPVAEALKLVFDHPTKRTRRVGKKNEWHRRSTT